MPWWLCVTGRPSAVALVRWWGYRSSCTRASTGWSSSRRPPAGPSGFTHSPAGSEAEVEWKPLSGCLPLPGRRRLVRREGRRSATWSGLRPRVLPHAVGSHGARDPSACRSLPKGTAVRHLLAAHGLRSRAVRRRRHHRPGRVRRPSTAPRGGRPRRGGLERGAGPQLQRGGPTSSSSRPRTFAVAAAVAFARRESPASGRVSRPCRSSATTAA